MSGCQSLANSNDSLKTGEHWVRQGQLLRARPYLQNSQQTKAQQYARQISMLQTAQQDFNQGRFAASKKKAQQVSQELPTLGNIHHVARQLVKVSQKAQQQKFLGPTVPTSLAQMDATQVGQQITAGILIDQKSGQVIWQKQARQVLPVASLSKLLAVYTIYQTLNTRKISLQTAVVAPTIISGLENHSDLSTAKLTVGHSYTIEQLLQATLVASANDAVMVLGQYLYGSQEHFVQIMLQNAQALHLKSVQLVNANGLPADIDPSVENNFHTQVSENQFCAQDLARLTQVLIEQFPQVLKVTQLKQINIDGRNLDNTNEMLPDAKYSPTKYQVDGLKTGTGEKAGYSTVITTVIQKRRVILVVLKAPSNEDRFLQARALLDYLAQNWVNKYKKLPTYPQNSWHSIWQPQHEGFNNLRLQYQLDLLKKPQRLDYSIWVHKQQLPILRTH